MKSLGVCPRCGEANYCCSVDITATSTPQRSVEKSDCWCKSVSIQPPHLQKIADTFANDGCLCRQCLQEMAQ